VWITVAEAEIQTSSYILAAKALSTDRNPRVLSWLTVVPVVLTSVFVV